MQFGVQMYCIDRLAFFAIPVQIGVSKFETALKLNTMSTMTAALAKF